MKKKIGIVGASGYAGAELLRLLLTSAHYEVVEVYSRRHAGISLDVVLPQFKGLYDLTFLDTESLAETKAEALFLAVPHATSAHLVKLISDAGINCKVVDLAADFRMSVPNFEQVYGTPHGFPAKQAVYGAPELWPDRISKADLVANPGCFAYCVLLSIYPLLAAGLVEPRVRIAAMTGSSGSGASAKATTHHPLRNDNVRVYGVFGHRHVPEVESVCNDRIGQRPEVLLVNQSGPFSRGIFATAFFTLKHSDCDAAEVMEQAYRERMFVRKRELSPEVLSVRGSNFWDYSVHQKGTEVVICAALDNLVKGAAGTAIQNLNLMMGLPESTGLLHGAVCP